MKVEMVRRSYLKSFLGADGTQNKFGNSAYRKVKRLGSLGHAEVATLQDGRVL
jgi:hypothetical protein